MAMSEGISQVHVEFSSGRRTNKAVKKWSEEQTDLFATILSFKYPKDGEESCWAEELENLAVKKSSNEKLFREIQASLEEELVKIDQSNRAHDEEATFSVPQLRAKYKWLKREWKIIQNKINCESLGKEEVKIPGWYKLLDDVFSVFLTSGRDVCQQDRPSMVSSNNRLLQNSKLNTDRVSDCFAATKERTNRATAEALTKYTTSALNRTESSDIEEREETESQTNKDNCDMSSSETPTVAPITIVRVPNSARQTDGQTTQRVDTGSVNTTSDGPPRKTRKLGPNERTSERECVTSNNNIDQCVCRSDSDRYVEIIKYLLDAEERREKMFVAFQREQAEANRQHELKMAQFFAQSLSQQKILANGIEQMLQSLSRNADKD